MTPRLYRLTGLVVIGWAVALFYPYRWHRIIVTSLGALVAGYAFALIVNIGWPRR